MAALTIPTLVQNYQTRAWDTASTVFTRKLEEALKVMNIQQTLAGYENTEDFVNELSKHIKITKICKNDDLTSCFEDKVYWGTDNEEIEVSTLTTASKFGQKTWNTETVGVQFANGTFGIIAYNPDCTQNPYSNQIKPTSCLAILYDTSAYKNPNTQNKDLRGINVASLGSNSCAFELDGICFGTPFQPTALTSADCNANKSKYGIKECRTGDDDYWGGAMKYCAEQGQHLANDAELTTLANDIYGKSISAGDGEFVDATLNGEKASSYGIPSDIINYPGFFGLWSGQETSVDNAHTRVFEAERTYWLSDVHRDYTDFVVWAFCVGG